MVDIPDRPEGWKPKEPEDFVRFYMGIVYMDKVILNGLPSVIR